MVGAAEGVAGSDRAESDHVRGLVVEAVEASAAMIARPEVAARWDEPSALGGMSVGALCAHLVRAAGATLAYLDRTDASTTPADAPDGTLLTPSGYFHAAIDSPIHDRIKQVSAVEASAGHREIADLCRDVARRMQERFPVEPVDRVVGALGGRLLLLDDFCRTRLIEVLLHLDDVAVSVGLPRPQTDPDGPAIAVDVLLRIARERHGDWAVLDALARTERSTVEILPVL